MRCGVMTAGTPALRMPAFSNAMASMLRPSQASWSKSTGVMTQSLGSTTLVASRRPPRPTSRTIQSQASRLADKCHRGNGLKVTGVLIHFTPGHQGLGAAMHGIEDLGELISRNGLAGDLNALGRFGEVRRGVEAGVVSPGAQSGFDHGAGRAFAVGPGDMYEAPSKLRIAQACKQRARIRTRSYLAAFNSLPRE